MYIYKINDHYNLIAILKDKKPHHELSEIEKEIQFIMLSRGQWLWDTFSFIDGRTDIGPLQVDKGAIKYYLKQVEGAIGSNATKVIGDTYINNPYLPKSVNDVLKALAEA